MSRLIGVFTRRATDFLALLGAVGVVAMLVHITTYVITRHLFSAPVPATVEIVSYYYMILIAFLPIAWAERRGDMITVEIFGQFFKGPVRKINAVFVALVTAAAYGALTYTTWLMAMRAFESKTFVISLQTAVPIWPGYFILPIAFGLAAIVTILKLYLILVDAEPEPEESVSPEEEFRE